MHSRLLTANVLFFLAAAAIAQQTEQKPRWQPAWPCTGKEPSFDPSYLHVAESTGGQLFLFDRSEAARSMGLINATAKHPATIARAVGKLEKQFEDVRVPVDSTVDSLLIAASLQCMTRITLYNPASEEMKPADNLQFRAGRIATIPNPQPGVWTVRIEGAGPYSISAQAHTTFWIHNVELAADHTASVTINSPTPGVRFKLIDAPASASQSLALIEAGANRYSGTVISGFPQFRIVAEGTDEQGYAFQRVYPRLLEAKP
ncbi:MAG TPA: hypothetical protein VNX18_02860 [Bryobacteraceae bacterium]|nr:hypothetical protein [Bryobacteraceae bacterium]